MNELNLAIIDDGIADCFKQDIDKFVVTNGKVMPNNATAANDRISHGTICLGIILKYANIPLHITSIKILKDNFRGDADNLDIALAWCIANNIDRKSVV